MHIKRIWQITMILGLALLVGGTAQAAVFTVDDFGDSVDANPGNGVCADGAGDCSLRAAIQEANALAGADTINLPEAVTLDIPGEDEDLSATGDLDISDDLTITGAGEAIAIITQTIADRVFHIVSSPLTVQISGVRITGGAEFNYGGGGILNGIDPTVDGVALTLTNTTVTANASTFGAGIRSHLGGALTLNNCTVSDNDALVQGGGIYDADGDLTLTDSTVSGNTSGFGGGLRSTGGMLTINSSDLTGNEASNQGGAISVDSGAMLTLNDSTIGGNTASTYGGGIDASGGTTLLTNSTVSGNTATNFQGGGISAGSGAVLTLTNSTVSGNTANTFGGGINIDGAVLTLTNSTITDNVVLAVFGRGGGVEFNGGTPTLTNTIIAGNSAPASNANCDTSTSVTSVGYNLDDDNSCNLTQPSDLPSANAALGPLQDNGGPTFTHALLAGSEALDQIPNGTNGCGTSPLDEDQRGEVRPEIPAGLCDIGAFERSQTCAGDADCDTVADALDNCPANANLDQLNSDCTSSTFFVSGACSGTVTLDRRGCCDGGDVCDVCANDKTNKCAPSESVGGSVSPTGGTISTPDGAIQITLPPGAVATPTSISATERSGGFNLEASGGTLFRADLTPNGASFAKPATVRFTWNDADNDGDADRGTCAVGGATCDDDSACGVNGPCQGDDNVVTLETNLVLKRNGIKFSSDTCGDHDIAQAASNGCDTATAGDGSGDCTDPATAVAKCCDPENNTWQFETCGFSEFFLGDVAGNLIPGRGNSTVNCIFEWSINNPDNQPYLDRTGLPSTRQTCTDGDLTCDADGAADGACTFSIGACLNVDDSRLVKGVAQCTGDNTESWQIRRPRPDSSRPEQATASTVLRDLVAALGTSTISGKHAELVTFVPPLVDLNLCSAHVDVVVPLRKGTRRARLNIATRTVTAPPGDSRRGVSDQDKVQLTCEPPEPE